MKFAAIIFAGVLALVIVISAQAETPSTAKTTKNSNNPQVEPAKSGMNRVAAPSQLVLEDLKKGKGAAATKNKKIKVHYTGWLWDASQPQQHKAEPFDSSVGKSPFIFTLGAGEVISGWDEGFKDMKVGGKRRLIIPPRMGYGTSGVGGVIPPNATLVFEVELLEVL